MNFTLKPHLLVLLLWQHCKYFMFFPQIWHPTVRWKFSVAWSLFIAQCIACHNCCLESERNLRLISKNWTLHDKVERWDGYVLTLFWWTHTTVERISCNPKVFIFLIGFRVIDSISMTKRSHRHRIPNESYTRNRRTFGTHLNGLRVRREIIPILKWDVSSF